MLYIVGISGLVYLLMQAYIAWGWKKIPPYIPYQPPKLPPLSVIIAAHNERPNLERFLPHILSQSYPEFEVIVALDRCTDGSESLLREWQSENPHLRIVEIPSPPADWSPKKWALTCAIDVARHDQLVFTDADCMPEPEWLTAIGTKFRPGVDFILGLGPYFAYPGLLNRFIRFETFYTAFQYIGLAVQGFPYMGVGRNLAYRKKVFVRNQGFEKVKDRLSGDDDLLVNALAKGGYTQVVIRPGSRTLSEPKRRFGSWARQKVRHLSASKGYTLTSKYVVGLFHLAHTAHWAGFWAALLSGNISGLLLAAFLTRILGSWYIFGLINLKYGEKGALLLYPILDLLFSLYNLCMVPWALIAKPEWKNNHESQKILKKTGNW